MASEFTMSDKYVVETSEKFNQVSQDVAVIKTEILGLVKTFDEFKDDTKKINKEIDERVTASEISHGKLETKTGNLAIFQSVFSIIIGGISGYLGIPKS